MQRLFTTLLLAGMAGLFSVRAQETSTPAPEAAAVGVFGICYQTTNVRTGPDTRYDISGQLGEGDRVRVTGRDSAARWLRVELPTGGEGWLPAFSVIIEGDLNSVPAITQTDPDPSETVTVTAYGRVNVRTGPSVEYDIVTQLSVNDTATAVARSSVNNDWLLIQSGEIEGWVAYFTVNVAGDARALPVLVPDSSGQALVPPTALIRTRFNVRLREQPALASAVLLLVPFNSEVTPIGRSADNSWLLVNYQGDQGWGAAQLFEIALADIRALPIVGRTLSTPTLTPTLTLTPAPTQTSG